MKKNYFALLMFICFGFAAVAQDVVLWGGAGSKDGEFNGGLNNWTTNGVKSGDPAQTKLCVWTWSSTSNAPGGYTGVANTTLNSASKSNGCAVFNSDVLDSGSNPATKEPGVGGTCFAPHTSELVSPTIDVKNDKDLTIVFSQVYRNFQSKTYIQYSKDDGKTWSENVPIFVNDLCQTYRYNLNFSTSVVTRVQLPGAGGTDKFKFKFIFDGDYYFWCIDDVAVVRQEETNMRTNYNFYAVPENLVTPVTQLRATPFLNDIENLGSKAATNVKHFVTIRQTNATGAILMRDSLTYASIAVDTTVENKLFAKRFTPAGKGTYYGQYSITSNGTDAELTNNSIPFAFSVSDSTYAKETRRTRSVVPGFDPGEEHNWAYGNAFYIAKGKNFKASTVEFGIDNATNVKDEVLTVYLYKWEDANSDSSLQQTELTIVGISEYKVKGNEPSPTTAAIKLIKVSLENFDEPKKPILLEDNTLYVALVESNTTGKPADVFMSSSDDYEFTAASLAYEQAGEVSYSDVLKVGDQFFSGGFANVIPMVRFNIAKLPSDIEDVQLEETAVKVGPNPTTNYVNLNFNFTENMKEVKVNMVDMAGKTVLMAQYENIQNDVITLNADNLVSGTYQLYITTNKGVTTKSIVVQK
jgi:Secretion system C-terminal sorting domain